MNTPTIKSKNTKLTKSIRLTQAADDTLRQVAEAYDSTQSEVIESMINSYGHRLLAAKKDPESKQV